MDPTDAIVNAIMAEPGPAYASSSAVTNTATTRSQTAVIRNQMKMADTLVKPGPTRDRLPPELVAKIKKIMVEMHQLDTKEIKRLQNEIKENEEQLEGYEMFLEKCDAQPGFCWPELIDDLKERISNAKDAIFQAKKKLKEINARMHPIDKMPFRERSQPARLTEPDVPPVRPRPTTV